MRASLVALTLALSPPAYAEALQHIGTFTWASETINGVSGLEVSDDGTTFLAVSDKGWFLEGTFKRTGTVISGVKLEALRPILGMDGLPVSARRVGDWSDAEGLASNGSDGFFVTFERWSRAAKYDSPTAAATFIKDHPTFYDFRNNRQLEAAAMSPDGRLHVFSEEALPSYGAFPVYVFTSEGWEITGTIEAMNRFGIVGADFGPDGRLYLLERKLVLGRWWQSRIRVFDVPEGRGEVLWTSRRGEFFNLEGIAAWSDEDGIRLTLVSDNNQRQSEPTQFVEFRLTE